MLIWRPYCEAQSCCRQAKKRSQSAKRTRDSEQEESISNDENDPGVANQATSETAHSSLHKSASRPPHPLAFKTGNILANQKGLQLEIDYRVGLHFLANDAVCVTVQEQ